MLSPGSCFIYPFKIDFRVACTLLSFFLLSSYSGFVVLYVFNCIIYVNNLNFKNGLVLWNLLVEGPSSKWFAKQSFCSWLFYEEDSFRLRISFSFLSFISFCFNVSTCRYEVVSLCFSATVVLLIITAKNIKGPAISLFQTLS